MATTPRSSSTWVWPSTKGTVEGFVEGCLERIIEDNPEGEEFLRSEWKEGDREMALEILKAECEVLPSPYEKLPTRA